MGISHSVILVHWEVEVKLSRTHFLSKKLPLIFIPYAVLTSSISVFIRIWSTEHCTRKKHTGREPRGYRVITHFAEINHDTTRQSFPNTTKTTGDGNLLLFLAYLTCQQKQYNKYKNINSTQKPCECPSLQIWCLLPSYLKSLPSVSFQKK